MNIKVFFEEKEVGILAQNPETKAYIYKYNPEFLNSGIELSPFLMPLGDRRYSFHERIWDNETFKSIPPLFADSLPDDFGNRLMKQWLIEKNIDDKYISPLEKLSYIGKRAMGGLEYVPDLTVETSNNPVYIDSLVSLINDIIDEKEDTKINYSEYKSNLKTMLRIGSSVGGARAKALIALSKDRTIVKAGDIIQSDGDFDYYLIKFDGIKDGDITGHREYGLIEHLYFKLAKKCDIEVPETEILEQDDLKHFLIKRFDRDNNKKIHQQTLCAMVGADFRKPKQFSYENFFSVLKDLKLPYKSFEELYNRMVFNVIFKNNDDHTKNFSFLYKNNKWELSPAYDITFAFDKNNYWLKQSNMTINGKADAYTLEDLEIVAERFEIYNYKDILEKQIEVLNQFKSEAKKIGISHKTYSNVFDIIQSFSIVEDIVNFVSKKNNIRR